MDADLIGEMTKANRMSMAKTLRKQALDRQRDFLYEQREDKVIVANKSQAIKSLDGVDKRHELENALKRKLHAREIEVQKEND